jgi:hypothetical protein
VRSLLGSSPAATDPITATGAVTLAQDGGFSLTLETAQRAQTHRRTLAAPRCEELSDAGALIVALAVDPKLVVPATTPDPDPAGQEPHGVIAVSEPEPSASPPPIPPPPPDIAPTPVAQRPVAEAPRAEAPTPLELRVLIAALGDAGALPRPAGGVALGAGLARDAFRLDAVGTVLPFARQVIAPAPERGGDVMLLAGGLRGCVSSLATRLEAGVCAGLEAGLLEAEGFNTADDDPGRSAWFAGRLGLTGRVALSQTLALAVDLEALVPVPAARPKFVILPTGLVHQPSAVVGRLAIGLELAFFRRKRAAADTKD